MSEQIEMRAHVQELDVHGVPRPATMPEESTTVNLVRRLAVAAAKRSDLYRVVLHSRPLEGGRRDKAGRFVRLPSGADLQFALRTPTGLWINLLLQAKRLYPPARHGDPARYRSWKQVQNQHLINWAAKHNQTPGMILYNDLHAPFVAQPSPATPQDWVCTAFGGCTGANRVQLTQFSALTPGSEFDSTPAGVSLCVDVGLMQLDAPTALDIAATHFPLEHLAHVTAPASPQGPPSGDLGVAVRMASPAAREPAQDDGVVIPMQADAPRWAARLLTRGPVLAEAIAIDDEDFQVPISLVLDLGPDETPLGDGRTPADHGRDGDRRRA